MNEDDTFDVLKYPPTKDEIAFGRKKWIYCSAHLNYHMTGWCTVTNQCKILLKANSAEEAKAECDRRGWTLFR